MSLLTPPSGGEVQWLYLDLNSFFASVEQQENPALRDKPVGVLPLESEYTSIIAASYEAKKYGIKTNTSVREARDRCPQIQFVSARHDVYVKYHHRIIEAIERCVPMASVHSIDEFACELTGSQRNLVKALALAKSIKRQISTDVGAYVRCSIGLAPNRYLAKVASDMQKPDGLTVLTPDMLPGPLFSLQLRDLPGIGQNMERRLLRRGLYSVEQLWESAPRQLRQIWGGVQGERFWYLLHGHELPLPETFSGKTQRSIGHSHVLPPEERPQTQARGIARRLLTKAGSRLRTYGLLTAMLSLRVRMVDMEIFQATLALEPTQDDAYLLQQLMILWEEFIQEYPRAHCKKVGIILHGLSLPEETTLDLFAVPPKRGTQYDTLSHALDAIKKRYGKDVISIGQPKKTQKYLGEKIAFNRVPDNFEE